MDAVYCHKIIQLLSCKICVINIVIVCIFLAGVLAWKDPQVLIPAIQIAKVLMQKLPDIFSKTFVREGVVHVVDMLILSNQSSPNSIHPLPGKDQDGSMGAPPKPRRNRRRTGGSNSEANGMEEPKGMSTGTSSSPPSSGDVLIPALNSGRRAVVSAQAKRFKDTYFHANSGVIDARIKKNLCNLKSLCTKLNGNLLDPKSKSKGKGKIVGHASFANEEQL